MEDRKGAGVAHTLAKPLLNANPQALTVLSLLLAGIGGLLYYFGSIFLIFSFLAILFSSYLDAADGEAARHQGKTSPRGDLLDHTVDRYSDLMIIVGMGLSFYSNPYLCIGAVTGIMMTSYMGTQSQALGLGRDYSGPMGRAYRLVVVMVATIVQFVVPYTFAWYFPVDVTTIVLLWFFLGGFGTAFLRFGNAYRNLGPKIMDK